MTLPLFWNQKFTNFVQCSQAEIKISNQRKFLVSYETHENTLKIPGRLTFGGFFSQDTKTITAYEFTEVLENFLSETKLDHALEWKLPPDYFYPQVFATQYENLKGAAQKEVIDLNQYVLVGGWNFGILSKGNKKKYRQAVKANLIYHQASLDDIAKCYQVLYANRSALGVKVSMTETEVHSALKMFPDFYKMHFLEVSGQIAAMCLTVDIAPKIRYVLYWADNLEFRNISPLVFLFERLVTLSKSDQVEILDLGISSINGEVNDGLFNFKKNLGALSSMKKSIYLPRRLT